VVHKFSVTFFRFPPVRIRRDRRESGDHETPKLEDKKMKCRRRIMLAAGALAAIFGIGVLNGTAQTVQGRLRAWGDGKYGQLGVGPNVYISSLPLDVPIGNVVAVGSSTYHSLALKPDGTVWAWGDNVAGELGTGNTFSSRVPVPVSGLSNVVSVSAGSAYSLALKADGTVWSWGANDYGQLGRGTVGGMTTTPAQVSGITDVIQIAAGAFHNLALKSDGTVWAWGWGGDGQLGVGSFADSSVPVHVLNLPPVTNIYAGYEYSMARKADGTVYTWGDNQTGELGNGSFLNASLPSRITALSNVTILRAGAFFGLAQTSDGSVWAWGNNNEGILGNLSINMSNVPVLLPGVHNVTQLGAASDTGIELQPDGSVWAWGWGMDGQMGNGSGVWENPDPVRVSLDNPLLLTWGLGEHLMAIVPPPSPIPFSSASPKLTITGGRSAGFDLTETFTLGANSNGINAPAEDVTLRIGTYSVIFPFQGFKANGNGKSSFTGVVNGVSLSVQLQPVGANSFSFKASGAGVNLGGLANPVLVTLTIGDDVGSNSVNATFR
jgi:alpha-tubulin suppressor-like RCC1 family protein